jgi:hypothetical protein
MKKIIGIMMVLMLMPSLIPLALADEAGDSQQDDVEIDAQTESEVEAMEYQYGAEIRLLQLEKSITANILKGQEAVSALQELGYTTIDLEAILSELEILLDEVQSVDANSTNATQEFIDLKSDAKELTEDFREAVHSLIDDDAVEGLRERIRNMTCEQVQNLTSKIQNKIRLYNRNQLHRLYGILGEPDESILNQYQKGNITQEQVKNQINKIVNQMTKEKRNQIFAELKESNVKEKIQARVCVDDAIEGFQERKQLRLKHRLKVVQDSENMNSQVQNQMHNKISNRIYEITSGNGNGSDNGFGGSNGNGGGGKQ